MHRIGTSPFITYKIGVIEGLAICIARDPKPLMIDV
jgi:hypothetical protein